jgi:hypothetical protein
MRLSRRASWFLLIFCLWTWFIWVTLVKNIWADPRSWNGNSPTGFLMVHVVLAIVSLVMGSAIGWLGWKGLKASKAAVATAEGEERDRASVGASASGG